MPEKCKKCEDCQTDQTCAMCRLTGSLIEESVPEECPRKEEKDD